ncbi:MAG: DnaJ domain-containing protein [Myxococcales bacterium]|nr:DnaJ domain-containing protein [Myxococcales bacterium]
MTQEPLASGSLQKTPFPHLLMYLEQRGLSGTLAVWPDAAAEGDKRQDRILLFKGRPVGARVVEPARDLHSALLRIFARRTAPYAFYEGNLLGDAEGRLSGRIDPLALIAEALRNHEARDDVVAEVLGRIANNSLALQPNVDPERFGFTPEERALFDLLGAGPQTLESLVAGSSLEQMSALRTIYLLVISKSVTPMTAQPPPPPPSPQQAANRQTAEPEPVQKHPAVVPDSVPAAHPAVLPESDPPEEGGRGESGFSDIPPPPANLDEELRKRWLGIVTKGKLIDNENYFEMLGLPKSAKVGDAKAQFPKLAKEWHPDRLPAEMSALRPYVQTIFGYMNEAYSCLSDEKQRLQYIQTVREGGGTPATDRLMQRILDSAMEYERVLVMTRKHQYEAALEALKRILDVTKDEPDYHAMYGWLLMQKYPTKPGVRAPYDEMLAACETALELHANHEKAHLYKAQILRRMGRTKEALDHFREVVRINPNNLDAAREVRIAHMRGQSLRPQAGKAKGRRKKEEPKGLLGKLFGKK